jgi:hypothetical protein
MTRRWCRRDAPLIGRGGQQRSPRAAPRPLRSCAGYLALGAVAALAATSCSFSLPQPPTAVPRPGEALGCSTNRDLPVLDTVGAVAFGVGGVAALVGGAVEAEREPSDLGRALGTRFGAVLLIGAGVVALALAIVYVHAADRGFDVTRRCAEVDRLRADAARYRPLRRPGPAATPASQPAPRPPAPGSAPDVLPM